MSEFVSIDTLYNENAFYLIPEGRPAGESIFIGSGHPDVLFRIPEGNYFAVDVGTVDRAGGIEKYVRNKFGKIEDGE